MEAMEARVVEDKDVAGVADQVPMAEVVLEEW